MNVVTAKALARCSKDLEGQKADTLWLSLG